MNEIKYIGFYNEISNKDEERNSVLAATNKMDYIVDSLNKIGYKVSIISPAWTTKRKFYKGKNVFVKNSVIVKLFPTLPWGNKIQKMISVIFSFTYLFVYLLFNVKNTEQIIVYHSRWLSLPILLLKKIKRKITLILEVEEIYNDVRKSKFWERFEYKLFDSADKFIFPTELLNDKINVHNKPFTVLYGSYNIEPSIERKFNDGKIHVVYAGTLDPRKGSILAVEAAQYLPSNYHIHIIGFGRKKDKDNLLKVISDVSVKSDATVSYDGLLDGNDYIEFLQKCDIGLSTQIPNAEYNETSFPSKILSYLTNGLKVVSIKIKAIEISALREIISFYNEADPVKIAEAIVSTSSRLGKLDSRERICKLDGEFKNNLRKLLGS